MAIQSKVHTCKSIAPLDRDVRDGFVFPAGPSPGQFVSIWGNKIVMMIVVAAGIVGLCRFAFHVNLHDQKLAMADQACAGTIVRSEVLHVWLPPTFIEFAQHQPSSGAPRTHKAFKRVLALRGWEALWYAITTRAYMANGDFIDLPFVRQPFSEPGLFPEILEILAVITEDSCAEATNKFSSASVHVLTEESMKREIRDVMAELQRNPYSLVGLEHRADSRAQ
jgi:hypothetical protein